jgi:hypothetical protein
VAQCKLQPSGKEESGDEPPLSGLWKGTDETGQQGRHTQPCGANLSAPEREAASAAHPDELKPGTNPAAVATTQRQEEARREADAERLLEQGSLWRSSRRSIKRRLAERLAPRNIIALLFSFKALLFNFSKCKYSKCLFF